MTRAEMIKYFNRLAFEFDTIFARTGDLEAKGKSEAYELAAFNIERNLKNTETTEDEAKAEGETDGETN